MSEKQVQAVESNTVKKVTELSSEEIKQLDFFPVKFSKIDGKDKNGSSYSNCSFSLTLTPELIIKEKIQVTDFYYVVHSVCVPKLKLADNKNFYTFKCPVRFVKGIWLNEEGIEKEYSLLQIIVDQGIIFSTFINKRNNQLNLMNTLINLGKLKEPKWVHYNVEGDKDSVLSAFNYTE